MLKTREIEIIHRPGLAQKYHLPLFAEPICADFPSPADDYLQDQLDLNRHLIKQPAANFFMPVYGDSHD